VYVHGGPTAQSVNSFSRLIQHMVNQGYMVIAPNYRGSTGYGKEFQQANLFDMGGGDLQDVLAAAQKYFDVANAQIDAALPYSRTARVPAARRTSEPEVRNSPNHPGAAAPIT